MIDIRLPRFSSFLCCLGERDTETGLFLYHCLDYDVVESGKTWEEAWQSLKQVLKAHMEYCYAHNPSGLLRGAKRSEWDKFGKVLEQTLRDNPSSILVESIEIEMQPPLPVDEIPIWIQGVTPNGVSLAHA